MIVRLVRRRASWSIIEPTPPAAPMINNVSASLSSFFSSLLGTHSRSNNNSQAVIDVRGRAAADSYAGEQRVIDFYPDLP